MKADHSHRQAEVRSLRDGFTREAEELTDVDHSLRYELIEDLREHCAGTFLRRASGKKGERSNIEGERSTNEGTPSTNEGTPSTTEGERGKSGGAAASSAASAAKTGGERSKSRGDRRKSEGAGSIS